MHPVRTQNDVDKGLEQLLAIAPQLAPVAERAGPLPLRLQDPGFAGLARIIIGQQVSRASADAVHARFAQFIDPQTPERFLEQGEDAWIKIGLSRAKQKSLSCLADALIAGRLRLEDVAGLEAKEAMRRLTAIVGIGPWTAEVYLLFCEGHPDLFPAGDLALREAVFHGLKLDKKPDEKQTRLLANAWKPYRGVAARLFWAYYKAIKQGRGALPV